MGFVEKLFGFKNEIKWSSALLIISYHCIAPVWCYYYAFPAKFATMFFAFIMFYISGQGITCGAHRYFTHKTFKATPALRVFFVCSFCAAGQNSIIEWVRDHRLHHKCSDTEADPHNANRGLFFSHIGWLMMKKNKEVLAEGKTLDLSDLYNDKLVMFQEKYSMAMKIFFAAILPVFINVYFFNEDVKCAIAWQLCIRYLTVLHSELTVNSLAHIYGYKPYNKNIVPKENRFVSFVTFGEGWHNYHHTFPFDYKAAEFFDIFDISSRAIRMFRSWGFAYDLKEASPALINAVINKVHEGKHSFIGAN